MFEERATKAAAQMNGPATRGAVRRAGQGRVQAAKSDQELRALDWWARVMKEKRIKAAKGAKQAYADWQRDPQGTTGQRASRFDVMFGNVRAQSAPSYEALLASEFERVSGPGLEAGEQPMEQRDGERCRRPRWSCRRRLAAGLDVLAIIDAVVSMVSIMYERLQRLDHRYRHRLTASHRSAGSRLRRRRIYQHKLDAFAERSPGAPRLA